MTKPNLLGVLWVLAGCGGPLSQAAARDAAARHMCDWYQKCGEVGSGKTYATRDACDVKERSNWDSQFPLAKCDGKVIASDLDVCLKAIDSTVCGNGLDLLNTVFNKCNQAQVCKGT